MRRLKVEVWSDVACPWCWVGKRNLEAALREFPHEVDVHWRAFELDAGAPKDPGRTDNVERLAKKYGVGRAQAQEMIDRMTTVGASVGIEFRFDRAQLANTFDAHRLLHWAGEHGRQDALKEALFVEYMHNGRSVADADVLVDAAVAAGLDREQARSVVDSDVHADDVRADERTAQQIGVRGVPFFVIDERFAVSGAQPAAALGKALAHAWDQADAAEPADAEVCGPDGCAVAEH